LRLRILRLKDFEIERLKVGEVEKYNFNIKKDILIINARLKNFKDFLERIASTNRD
jgi:hypothetical protein